jgi:hypothetical protein
MKPVHRTLIEYQNISRSLLMKDNKRTTKPTTGLAKQKVVYNALLHRLSYDERVPMSVQDEQRQKS